MTVAGMPVRNPASRVAHDAAVAVVEPRELRGVGKLGSALDAFGVPVAGRVALDAGAAAGGFTRALLDRGARRVYAVDAGWGQLVGSLRQDERVVNLERTNVGELSRELVPDAVELVTLDLSYLALARAVPQLESLALAHRAELVALVKPMFELGLARPPTEPAELARALELAVDGIAAAGWQINGTRESDVRGSGGTTEFFVYATRAPRAP